MCDHKFNRDTVEMINSAIEYAPGQYAEFPYMFYFFDEKMSRFGFFPSRCCHNIDSKNTGYRCNRYRDHEGPCIAIDKHGVILSIWIDGLSKL